MRHAIRYEIGIGQVTLAVDRLRGVEALGRPARFEIWCRDEGAGFELDNLARATVAIRIVDRAGNERAIRGVVTDVAVGLSSGGHAGPMRMVVESSWAIARHASDMRVFRNQSTVEIVTELLSARGAQVKARLRGQYPARHQTVQLRETELDFTMRLLEEDGIVIYETASGEVVLSDDKSGYEPWPRPPLPFDPGGVLEREGDAVLAIEERQDLVPRRVVARDFRRARPSQELTATAEVRRTGAGTRHLWLRSPAERRDPERTARLVAESIEAERAVLQLRIASVHPLPGGLLTVDDLPDASLPSEMLVTRVEHRVDDGAAAPLMATAIPGDKPFRTTRRTPKPSQRGPLTAFVAGPQHPAEGAGSDVFTDALGQIKIFYPWDRRQPRDARASDWVPVLQDNTGQSAAIPRIGWEVLVHYFEGDPDRPAVLGRLYNGADAFPEPLPANKTVSAMRSASSPNDGGKNMIRIDDAAGSERMDVHAEKDQRIVVEADEQRDVGEDRSREVAGKETVRVGGDVTLMVGGDYDVSGGGDSSTTVGKNRTVWVGLGDTVSTAGDHSLSIGSAHLRRIGRDDTVEAAGLDERIGAVHCEIALRNVSLSSKKTVTSIVGGASVGIARAGHKSTTKLARAEAVGAIALSKSAGDTSIEVGKTHDVKVGGVMSVTAGTAAGIEATGLELDAIGPFLLEGAKSVTLEVGENGVVIAEGTILVYGKKLIIDGESKLAFAEATIE